MKCVRNVSSRLTILKVTDNTSRMFFTDLHKNASSRADVNETMASAISIESLSNEHNSNDFVGDFGNRGANANVGNSFSYENPSVLCLNVCACLCNFV